MIIFLYGEDTYRSKERLKQLIQAFSKKYDKAGINISKLEGDPLDINEFRKNILSQGLLVKKRLIIIKDLLNQKKGKLLEEIEEELKSKNLLKDNILIFWEGASGKDLKKKSAPLFERLQKGKEVKEFEPLAKVELLRWIEKEIKKLGGKINPRAKEALALATGNNLWQASNEIVKLVGYKGKETIELPDIEKLIKTKYDENIFHLTEAFAEKNQQKAIRLVEEQLALGTDKLELLNKLVWQFRTLLKVKESIDEGTHQSQLSKEVGIHPFVAQKAAGQVRLFTLEELKLIYEKLLEIDFKIKTSQADHRILFDLFTISLARPISE